MRYVIYLFCLLSAPLNGDTVTLTPEAFGSVQDNPVNGIGDIVLAIPYIANAPEPFGNVYSAIVEYNASEFVGVTATAAMLTGTIYANNFLDTGDRIIEALVFAGTGVVEPSDFQISAASLGVVSYHPPIDRSVSFAFDLLPEFQALIADGSQHVGVRFAGVNFQAPSQLNVDALPILTVTTVPEPTSLLLLIGGLGVLALFRPRGKIPQPPFPSA